VCEFGLSFSSVFKVWEAKSWIPLDSYSNFNYRQLAQLAVLDSGRDRSVKQLADQMPNNSGHRIDRSFNIKTITSTKCYSGTHHQPRIERRPAITDHHTCTPKPTIKGQKEKHPPLPLTPLSSAFLNQLNSTFILLFFIFVFS
jgi:hypothetical protein